MNIYMKKSEYADPGPMALFLIMKRNFPTNLFPYIPFLKNFFVWFSFKLLFSLINTLKALFPMIFWVLYLQKLVSYQYNNFTFIFIHFHWVHLQFFSIYCCFCFCMKALKIFQTSFVSLNVPNLNRRFSISFYLFFHQNKSCCR